MTVTIYQNWLPASLLLGSFIILFGLALIAASIHKLKDGGRNK